ncbi:hypothetical protein O3G_MSEX011452 [Manduca sexta]|uniref:Intimal thickness related receptor IRP domain-containing protein n=4 Tax=Manduca sexta TaxID=7130 RepID=A0A922CV55_MANSE|nr:hypothetical protein O3G_MSEX011452 [Manduca sexta]
MGIPNLLLYYDDDSQWPAVYHSSKTCKEREAVLNKVGQNQIIKLSHWYPETEYSGCIVTRANKELPASKSVTTTQKPTVNPFLKSKNNTTKSEAPHDPLYYDQFLKTTAKPKSTTIHTKSTTARINTTAWYELLPTDDLNFTTAFPEDELWEHIGPEVSLNKSENLKDVEILFENNKNGQRIKRSNFELIERYRRRRLNSESHGSNGRRSEKMEKLLVSCHNTRRFRSARERWWFIAISNCDSPKGLEIKYKFLMTNAPDGDFWHTHFSADEFYVLPILLAYTFAYVIVMVAVVMCSVELKSRHLLHTTYKLFLVSIVTQHSGVMMQTLAYIKYAANGVGSPSTVVIGQFLCGVSEMTFLLLLVLMAKGYTITRGRLKIGFTVKLTVFMCCYVVTYIVLFIYQAKAFDPGEVLYLYESPPGYGLIVMRVLAWCVFAYSTFFTVRKYIEKTMFYCPFFICGTLWFFAGPLFILTANSYIDKWVRESVVTTVLLFIAFSGHVMFLMLTLPVFANKNFPYHVRTTQIGVMEVTGSTTIDSFGHNPYQPSNGAAQTVIIPLTRRTEELIGNMYSQYMATAPPISLENETPKLNGVQKRVEAKKYLVSQESTETNTSDDIRPSVSEDKEIFTVENQISKMENGNAMLPPNINPTNVIENGSLKATNSMDKDKMLPEIKNATKSLDGSLPDLDDSRGDLPNIMRSRRNILEPIKREEPSVPSWSLAKGPCVVSMQRKTSIDKTVSDVPEANGTQNGKKVPSVRNGLPSSGEISTIHEGHIQSFQSTVSKATIDLFNANSNKG